MSVLQGGGGCQRGLQGEEELVPVLVSWRLQAVLPACDLRCSLLLPLLLPLPAAAAELRSAASAPVQGAVGCGDPGRQLEGV